MITYKTPCVPNNSPRVDIENYLNYGDLWLNHEAIQILKYGFSKEIIFQRPIFIENLILKIKNNTECSHFFPQIDFEDFNYDADIDLEQEYKDNDNYNDNDITMN